MQQTFDKLRKKFHNYAWLKSALFGVAFGLAVVSVLWIVLKRNAVVWNPIFYVLIGIGAAAAACVGLYFLLRPSDKQLAKELDERLGQPEKIQTMLEFSKESGEVVEMQRKDAEKVLQDAPSQALKIRNVWHCIVALAVAIAMLVTAIFVPALTKEDLIPPEEKFEITEWQIKALQQLIEEVEDSKLEEEPKKTTLDGLNGLLDDLMETTLREDMKERVLEVIVSVDNAVETVNTYKPFSETLNLSLHVEVQRLSTAIATLENSTFTRIVNEMLPYFLMSTDFTTDANAFADEALKALENCTVDADDPLYAAVKTLAEDIKKDANRIANLTETMRSDEVKKIFKTYSNATVKELSQQLVNKETRDHVIESLKDIFQLSKSDLPELSGDRKPNVQGVRDELEEDEDDDSFNDGGLGDAEMKYASDDLIYSPDKGEQVQYGVVIDTYYAKYLEMKINGQISDEQAEYLDAYFDALYGTATKK